MHYGFTYKSKIPRQGGIACSSKNDWLCSIQANKVTCKACLRMMRDRGTISLHVLASDHSASLRGHIGRRCFSLDFPEGSEDFIQLKQVQAQAKNLKDLEILAFLAFAERLGKNA